MQNKSQLVEALKAALTAELNAAIGASRDAASYATDEEARASSKWDTQGLEASYLAAGQAQQAKELESTRQRLHGMATELAAPKNHVAMGALIQCALGGASEFFWLVPEGAGGRELKIGAHTITCLNPQSPLGRILLGTRNGEHFTLPNGSSGTVQSIS